MCQMPHCPPSAERVSSHLLNHSRRSSRSRFSCSKHLEGDGSQFGIRSEDAVSVKGGFVHEHKLDQVGAEVNRGRTVPRLSHAVEHLRNRLLIIVHRWRSGHGTEREPHERDGSMGSRPCWIICKR